MSLFNTATDLAVRLSTRDPQWVVQATPATTPPGTAISGVLLNDAPATLLTVAVREETHRRTSRLVISTLNIGDTFTVTVDGTAVAYDSTGDADLAEVLTGIAAAVNANGTVAAIVTADGSDGAQVVLIGDSAADYSVGFTRTGSSVIVVTADAAQCTAVIYWLMTAAPSITPPAQWFSRDAQIVLAAKGFVDRYPTGGFLRGYVHVDGLAGVPADGSEVVLRNPDVSFGPAISEG